MTNLTYGILPSFMWALIMPIMYLVSAYDHPLNTALQVKLPYVL